jgi:pentatricopeptide repeat protein
MAVNCYIKEMLKQGLKPNRRTYSSVLAACSHIGMVEQGCQHFEAMIRIHGIMPVFEHLNCIVDLFSRVGQLEEAERFLQTMPLDQSLTGWRALLTSCKVHGNLELGKDCHDQALELC